MIEALPPDEQSEFAVRQYRKAARPLLSELAALGFEAPAVADLLKIPGGYEAAVPCLLAWLPKVSYQPLKADIIRTLSVPWAGPATAKALIAEFDASCADGGALCWEIGNALSVLATDELADDLIRLATNEQAGADRQMIVVGLGKLTPPRADDVLLSLLADDDLVGHAAMALGRAGCAAAKPDLERLSREHPRRWVRTEAAKAVRRIDRKAKKK